MSPMFAHSAGGKLSDLSGLKLETGHCFDARIQDLRVKTTLEVAVSVPYRTKPSWFVLFVLQ